MVNLGSRDTRRNVSAIPRQVNTGPEHVPRTHKTDSKGSRGPCPARPYAGAGSAAALPEQPSDN